MAGERFDQAEFHRTMERLSQGTDHSSGVLRPDFDPKLHRDVVDHFQQGRKIDSYRAALEAAGFRRVDKERLPPYDDGRVRSEGEWRNDRMRLALTDSDITGSQAFRTPEEFSAWIGKIKRDRRLAAIGLKVAGGKLIDPRLMRRR